MERTVEFCNWNFRPACRYWFLNKGDGLVSFISIFLFATVEAQQLQKKCRRCFQMGLCCQQKNTCVPWLAKWREGKIETNVFFSLLTWRLETFKFTSRSWRTFSGVIFPVCFSGSFIVFNLILLSFSCQYYLVCVRNRYWRCVPCPALAHSCGSEMFCFTAFENVSFHPQ